MKPKTWLVKEASTSILLCDWLVKSWKTLKGRVWIVCCNLSVARCAFPHSLPPPARENHPTAPSGSLGDALTQSRSWSKAFARGRGLTVASVRSWTRLLLLPPRLVVAGMARQGGGAGGGRGRAGRHGGQRSGGSGVLGLLQLSSSSVQLLADAGLQGGRRQPLFGQAALEERHAGAEVGQTVHPARDLPATQDLEGRREGQHQQLYNQ